MAVANVSASGSDPQLQPLALIAAVAPDAAAWLQEAVHSAGLGPLRDAQLVADTSRSAVVRLQLPATDAHFPADRILPPPEAAILARLAPRWPAHIAPVIATDAVQGWSLTLDVGTPGLPEDDTSVWCRTVERFARIQRDDPDTAQDWLDLGCRDRRPLALRAQFDGLLEDCADELDDADRDTLAGLQPRIDEACRVLAGDGLPATLVHQDLVHVNIVVRDAEPVFLDWSDTVVGHPFFGCDRLLDSCWTDTARKEAVITAYLSAFADLAEEDVLRASFAAMLRLRVLYEGIRWRDEIAAMQPGDEGIARLRADQLVGLRAMAAFARR